MKLKTKFFIITFVATALPVIIGAFFVDHWLRNAAKNNYRDLLNDSKVAIQTHYKAIRRDLNQRLMRIADPDDRFIGSLLIHLAKGDFQDHIAKITEEAPRVMNERGFDSLSLIKKDKRIIALAHYPGKNGETFGEIPTVLSLKKRRVMQGLSQPKTVLVLEEWKKVRSDLGAEIFVGVGFDFCKKLYQGISLKENVRFYLTDHSNKALCKDQDGLNAEDETLNEVFLLGIINDSDAKIVISVSTKNLTLQLRLLRYSSIALVLAGFLLALLIAGLTQPISKPLTHLVTAARRIAKGDLESKIDLPNKQDEVGQLVSAFNTMIVDLKDSNERLAASERVAAWRDIARRIAHEIKNPLFPIQMSIETLRKVKKKERKDFDEIFEESTLTILEEVERVKKIVTEFSDFARMPKPEPTSFELKGWLESLIALHQDDKVAIHLSVTQDITLFADRDQLTQVITNLLKNAKESSYKALKNGRNAADIIDIAARLEEDFIEILVSDKGLGFQDDEEKKLFTPYFTTKKEEGGTGLGLAICHRIMTEHQGTIKAEKNEEGGASFRLRFPLHFLAKSQE